MGISASVPTTVGHVLTVSAAGTSGWAAAAVPPAGISILEVQVFS